MTPWSKRSLAPLLFGADKFRLPLPLTSLQPLSTPLRSVIICGFTQVAFLLLLYTRRGSMGCGAQKQASPQSAAVEKQLKEDAKAFSQTVKLLLLGTSSHKPWELAPFLSLLWTRAAWIRPLHPYNIIFIFYLFYFRCWRIRKVDLCQANPTHPLGWVHGRGASALQGSYL